MSKMTTLLIGLVSTIMCSPHAFSAQLPHAHIASPNHYEVLLDNSDVLVLRMTLAPGEQDNWHKHNAETVYFETGGKATISTNCLLYTSPSPRDRTRYRMPSSA